MSERQKSALLDQIRAALADSGLSMYEVSKRSGVDQATLSRLMHRERGISVESLEKLAPVVGLRIVMTKRK